MPRTRHGLWRNLTARGRFLLLLGLCVCAGAIAGGQRDVLALGALLVLAPLLALLSLMGSARGLVAERQVNPVRAALGDRMTARVRIARTGVLPAGILQFEDTVPAQLGRRPRFASGHASPSWQQEVAYPLLGLARGRHRVGPLGVRALDPFGLARLTASFDATTEVLVTPRVHPLGVMTDAGGTGTGGDTVPERIGRVGNDDVLVREYQQGDDIRRVHWRSSARWDQLMVRREEQAWEPAVTVLLDTRAGHHAGSGRGSSFEWAVSAAASICDHFAQAGYRVALVDADGVLVAGGQQDASTTREAALLALAGATESRAVSLMAAVAACRGGREGEIVVAVLAAPDADDVAALAGVRRTHSQGFALALDTSDWNGAGGAHRTPGPERGTVRGDRGADRGADRAAAFDGWLAALRDQRWRVVAVGHDSSVPTAWSRLTREAVG